MTTGQLIQAARKAAGLTQEALGEKLGISGSALAQYETGKRNPKLETLQRIAVALGVPVNSLLDPAMFSPAAPSAVIVERIKALCKDAGISKNDLLSSVGLSSTYLVQLVNFGRPPKLDDLQRIADYLGCPLSALILDTIPAAAPAPDLIPSEFNEFERFIESFGYYTRLDGDHYRIHHGNDSVEITPDELKRLVRSSRKTVAALLDAMMEEARG